MSIAEQTQPIELAAPALNEAHFALLERASEALHFLESNGVKSTYMMILSGLPCFGISFDDFKRLFAGHAATTETTGDRKHYKVIVDRIEYTSNTGCQKIVTQEVL